MTSETPEPALEQVQEICRGLFQPGFRMERTKEGASTFVYQIREGERTSYLRILPEDDSFAAEVLAHNILLEKGLRVPRVLHWEERNPVVNLSLMVVEEIPGESCQNNPPSPEHLPRILACAGRELALLNEIPVEGFGWVDRSRPDRLRGVHPTFRGYYLEFLEGDLDALDRYAYTPAEKQAVREHMERGTALLDREEGRLSQGDFDLSHIFHQGGRYTGLIDFGEIRGNHPLFDLGTLLLFNGRERLDQVLAGYAAIRPLEREDPYRIWLLGLHQGLRFLGKRAARPEAAAYFFQTVRRHLEDLGDAVPKPLPAF